MDADLISVEEPTSQAEAPKGEGQRRSIRRFQAGISFGLFISEESASKLPCFLTQKVLERCSQWLCIDLRAHLGVKVALGIGGGFGACRGNLGNAMATKRRA